MCRCSSVVPDREQTQLRFSCFLLWARRPGFPRSEPSLCGVRRQMVCPLSVLRVDLVSCLWPEQFAERGLADYV